MKLFDIGSNLESVGFEIDKVATIFNVVLGHYLTYSETVFESNGERKQMAVHYLCSQYSEYRNLLDIGWDKVIELEKTVKQLSNAVYESARELRKREASQCE